MEQLIQALASAAQTAAGVTGEQLGVSLPSLFEQPEDSAVGDLALPCFRLAKALRKSPAVIAADLAETIVLPDGVARAEAVNGYLNFFVDPAYYAGRVGAILQNPDFGTRHQGAGKTMVIDYSSPNIAKRFHVGHLGTTVIGNAIKNLHAFCGYRCVGINYLGDWGTQFGKLIVAYKKWSSADRVAERGIEELVDIYVRFSDESEKEPSLNDQARAAFAELERGNEEYLAIWRYFKEISLREYMKTYELLGIEFDSFDGESFFTDKMPAIVEELREKGLLVQDDGAWIVDLAPYGMPPALILKRDGSTLYPTRDIAAAVWRKKEYDFDKCIYVTSAGQSLHFAQWFKVVELMGYDWADRLVHVPYGTMSVGGEKLASRTGNVILLDDLFAEAISKAEAIMEEKNTRPPSPSVRARSSSKRSRAAASRIRILPGRTRFPLTATPARMCSTPTRARRACCAGPPAPTRTPRPAMSLRRTKRRWSKRCCASQRVWTRRSASTSRASSRAMCWTSAPPTTCSTITARSSARPAPSRLSACG